MQISVYRSQMAVDGVFSTHIAVGLWVKIWDDFFYCLKTSFRCFKWFGTYLKFSPSCVRACMRACTHTDQVLCVELVLGFGSNWNLYILKIFGLEFCTSPWGRRRFVRLLWEASELRSPQHLTNPSDFFNVLSWTPPRVLVGSILNLYRLKLYTSPSGRCRSVRLSVRGDGT